MRKLLVANWKSNKNRDEVNHWLTEFQHEAEKLVALEKLQYQVVICPPLPFLTDVSDWQKKSLLFHNVAVGIQDISEYPAGSFTGAVSAPNLEGLHVQYAIVGHSERRKFFKETSKDVALKVDQCIENDITPILCVDKNEIKVQADLIDKSKYKNLVVTYEPVDHIGTGVSQDLAEVLEVCQEIKEIFGEAVILYGGSVNPETITPFLNQELIEGFLVGTASLNVEKFVELMKK